MSERHEYPAGVPCFVDTLTPDPDAARRFYAGIFGWEFTGPGPMPGDPPGEYYVARLGASEVAGVGSAPPASPDGSGWNTHVAVASVEEAVARAGGAGGSVVLNPADALPAGRLAVIADPEGAKVTLWQAHSRAGAQRVNEPSAWAMSALATPDPEAAFAFYRALFGWEPQAFADGAMWLWRLPGYVGGEPAQPVPRDVVAALVPGDQRPAQWNVDFWIADVDAAAAAAPELGGEIVAPPFDDGPFRRTILAGPGGETFSLSRPPAR